MSTSAYVLEVNENNFIRGVYVHWDGGDLLAKTLKDHYIGNEEKLNLLFSDGYASDVSANEITRNNKENQIEIYDNIDFDDFYEESYFVEYFHIIKNGELITIDVEKYSVFIMSIKDLIKDHVYHKVNNDT